MLTNESLTKFVRVVNERHEVVKNSVTGFVSSLVDGDDQKKKMSAEVAVEKAVMLKSYLSPRDVPEWLKLLVECLDDYIRNFEKPKNLLSSTLHRIYPLKLQLDGWRWNFESNEERNGFNFDAMYEECKKNSKVDTLFDELIDLLQKIIDSGEVDSIKMNTTLTQIIATLKKHNTASYLALTSSWDFAKLLIKNVVWEELKTIKSLNALLVALQKTMEKTDTSMGDLYTRLRNRAKETFHEIFSFLDYPQRKLIEEKYQKEDNEFTEFI